MVIGRRSDILAWHILGSLVFDDLESLPLSERNWARLHQPGCRRSLARRAVTEDLATFPDALTAHTASGRL